MQVKFYGGSFHNQTLKVPGELRDLPSQLRNPLNETSELYVRHDIQTAGNPDVVYVLKGFDWGSSVLPDLAGSATHCVPQPA